ncbi:hypothetical protein P3S67_027465 [Capsicum chacoense]
MNNLERRWMYDRLDGRGAINSRFITGVNNFILFACSQQNCMSGDNIRCPCKKCRNIKYKNIETVRYHLLHDRFVKDYFIWKHQGKADLVGEISFGNDLINGAQLELGYDNPNRQMILDATGPNFNHGYNNIESRPSHLYEPSIEEEHEISMEEEPNLEYQKFYELFHSADAKLYSDSFLSQFAEISRMLNIKMKNNMSQRGFNQMMQLFKESLPEDNLLVDSYYQTKKLDEDASGKYPKAVYTIDKEASTILFNWVKGLKFLDGYVSNLGRCPDTSAKRLFSMKSHDCHVFMQRLMPIAFRELLPNNVWQELIELSLFFKDLTSTTLRVDEMERLQGDIPQILCKLEHIFPPGFFDSMEHLLVHLPYEVKITGPVQYRWMYPFERYLESLKRMIKNKSSVEGSICEAYLMTESTLLFSHYFEPYVMTRNHNVDRNNDRGIVRLNHIENEFLCSLARGSLIGATSHSVYFVNGYKFHTDFHGSARSTMNSGVCISDPTFGDFYERIKETIEKKDKDDSVAVLKIKPQNVIELPDEEIKTAAKLNISFQVEEVQVYEIDMNVATDESIYLHDANGGLIEMDGVTDDGLLQEHHDKQEDATEEEYETEETEEDGNKDLEEGTDSD